MERRSSGPILDPDIAFPVADCFQHKNKLPTIKSIIGLLRWYTEHKFSHQQAVKDVSKIVFAKWYHDTVYCISLRSIERKMTKLWGDFREGRKRWAGKQQGKAIEKYQELVQKGDNLFDIYADDQDRRTVCKEEWGVSMTQREIEYYEDMKTGRLMECDHGVDPVWYTVMMRRQRKLETSEKYKSEQQRQFQSRNLDEINEILDEQGEIRSSQDEEVEESDESQVVEDHEPASTSSARKRRKFEGKSTQEDNSMFPSSNELFVTMSIIPLLTCLELDCH